MNLYYIKVKDTDMYVNYVLINCGPDLSLTPNFDFGKDNAAIYEEDKAIKYSELLNENSSVVYELEKAIEY